MMPLLLGNVPDMKRLRELADTYNLFIVEDSCDTLGARFEDKPTGMFSDISTTSFYGSHIITAGGGGGMLLLNREDWRDRAKVLRGWGRSSSVLKDHEKIEDRFNVKLDNITYDANFIFDERGYNFLPMEIGAAFGNAQLDKLPQFRKIRQANFENLLSFFKQYESFFMLPQQSEKIDTQWLAFPLTIKKTAPFTRLQIATHLEKNNIQTRTVFTGNILKQPAFKDMPHIALPEGYPATDEIMERGFLKGCHHGMEEKHLQKIKNVITSFITANT
jgi:CDP-6-deoxy-D-xylo-4-hexulose-3-dehydrase